MKITSPEALANALRQSRKQQNLTQAGLSALVGTKQTPVSALEYTPENSKIETLFKLLSGLELEICIEPSSHAESVWSSLGPGVVMSVLVVAMNGIEVGYLSLRDPERWTG